MSDERIEKIIRSKQTVMQFTRCGEFHEVERITGPTHNFLAIALSTGGISSPTIEALPGFCHHHGALNPEAILNFVQEGLSLANDKFGTNFSASQVQYRLGDNPPEVVYAVLAFKIVEHIISVGEFTQRER